MSDQAVLRLKIFFFSFFILCCAQSATALPLIFTPANTPRSGTILHDGGLTVSGGAFFAEDASEFGIDPFNGIATITRTAGGLFDLLSIEMSKRDDDATVNFTGSNGATISFLVTTESISLFNFGSTFLGVTSVTYDANGGVSGPFASQGVITAAAAAVPEIDVATGTIPVAIFLSLFLLLGDRRRRPAGQALNY